MILFQNWNIEYIGGLFARQYDNLSRTLEVTGVPEGYDWNMMVQVGGNFDILSLSPMEGGVGVVLTANQLSIAGYYKLQLVGTLRSDGVTKRHTNVLQVYVPGSLSGDANWPTVPSEFSQVEANIRELNSHPPIPGDNGYWMIWDLESHGYTESEFPLPEVTTGPAGADGTTFTPSVSADGVLSWTNDGGLENPAPVDIRGPAGKDGEQGPAGEDGLGVPAATAEDAGKVPVVQADGSYGLGRMIPAPETAEVGQTIVVKAVDENGKPTEWEASDMAGGGWELITDVTIDEDGGGGSLIVTKNDNGEDFEYRQCMICLSGTVIDGWPGGASQYFYLHANNTGAGPSASQNLARLAVGAGGTTYKSTIELSIFGGLLRTIARGGQYDNSSLIIRSESPIDTFKSIRVLCFGNSQWVTVPFAAGGRIVIYGRK